MGASTCLVSGCGAADELPTSDADQGEPVAEVEQAVLGDISCASSWNKDYVIQYSSCNLAGGQFCSYTTPDGNYGNDYTSGETCQPYMNLHTQTGPLNTSNPQYPMTVQYWAYPWGVTLPNNSTDCKRFRIELAAYYFDQSGGGWHLAGTRVRSGYWQNGSCYLQIPTINVTLTCNSLNQCKTAQVVTARAYQGTPYWWPNHKRVKLGIFRLN